MHVATKHLFQISMFDQLKSLSYIAYHQRNIASLFDVKFEMLKPMIFNHEKHCQATNQATKIYITCAMTAIQWTICIID